MVEFLAFLVIGAVLYDLGCDINELKEKVKKMEKLNAESNDSSHPSSGGV